MILKKNSFRIQKKTLATHNNRSGLKEIGAVLMGAHKSKNLSKSADRITLLRDANNDGVPEMRETFLTDLAISSCRITCRKASLGLVFYQADAFPEKHQGGAFIVQHGSWNRSTLSGYKVVFIPFSNGKPVGEPEDFLTGFINELDNEKVYGRPVGVVIMPDGAMHITDDVTNTIWRVSVVK